MMFPAASLMHALRWQGNLSYFREGLNSHAA
jgi:hypothetical protein